MTSFLKKEALTALALSGALFTYINVNAQESFDISAINIEEDYDEVLIYQDPDIELKNKLNRYIKSKEKEVRILNAETKMDIEQIKKRARLAGTEEAKEAALEAIKAEKQQLRRELSAISDDIKQKTRRVRNAINNN